ncbi:MAG: hypothetical protein ACJ8FG_08265 [Sphingomicrobium sp.]
MVGEHASSLRTFANIRMKPMSVVPLILLLIIVLYAIYALRPH